MSKATERGRTGPARVKISDVANALGLTKSTVSRALNGHPDISEMTRQRVVGMANEMNYHPLSHAQAIKTGRTRSLGFVLQFADHDAHRPFLAEFLAGLSAGASAEKWTLTVAAADSDAAMIETFGTLIRYGKADGFVLPRPMIEDSRIEYLSELGVPFVLYGRHPDQDGWASFDILGEEAMREAVLHLASLGHRRIAFINGGARYTYAGFRLGGFTDGMAQAGLAVDPGLIASDAVTQAQGEAAAMHMLARPEPPTAIICAVDFAALGVYRAAARLGLGIGSDLSVIGYDGIPEGATAAPPLATFAVDIRAAGARLATLLIRQLRGDPASDLQETTNARFVEGRSTGPVPTGPNT